MSLPRYGSYRDSGVERLGDVPSHWEVCPLKLLSSVNDEALPETTDGDFQMEYVDIGSVSLGAGIEKTEAFTFETAPSRARRIVRHGDVIVSTVRTYLKSIAPILSPAENLVVSTGFAVVRPNSTLDSGFAKFALQCSYFVDEVIARSTGVSYPAINATDLARIRLPAPPILEQTFIASFLDSETAKIDALISEQEKLITLLAEKRQATISRAVTKGLNPNTPMKASGVEWMGNVPEHWRLLALERVTVDKCDGPFGSGIKSEHYTDEGALVIRLQNIWADEFNPGTPVFVNYQYFVDKLQGHDVKEGDLLVAGLGDDNNLLGRACVAPKGIEPALVKADCFRFRLDTSQALPTFAAAQLSAGARNDAGRLSSGSTRSRIPLGTMTTRKVALPPLAEQSAIVDFLRFEIGRVDILTIEATRGIALLKERRSALISAAVTGKIDVRQAVQPEQATIQEAA